MDLEEGLPGALPPKGPNSFILRHKIFKMYPPLQSIPTPLRGPPPT